ncbi:orotidine-5'-phosphate decarboxylase [Aliifodinibius salicampi]|uniref:Orotidine-5'-phosphate decarboxylase n=1 Tax=Fodinibius salicampi TaxID=1920655 RepID=A0ABT3Q341_9BACT|nr:orotidine-5'-phosphate decarboxylase [Fodinibius salicampi]MCW9714523.1 orotidine-5'-phosphate decarboxylase [Fodinibius salicampi]
MTFREKLKTAIQTSNSTLCVGLDPNLDRLPADPKWISDSPAQKVEQFLKTVIDATSDFCAAYKPNLGFFEALGPDGWDTFEEILDYIPSNKIIIADAKRGDISSTAEHYAKAFFEQFDIDAITLNPLMGFETLDPFLSHSSKGVYVLTLTSNPGAKDILLQELSDGQTVSSYISKQLSKKQASSDTSIGMVVGATKAQDLGPVITPFRKAPLLIPGIGKQGGSITELKNALHQHQGLPLVNSSRSIIYAGEGSANWEKSVARAAENYKKRLGPITEQYV